MALLKKGDRVGLIACSDGLRPEERAQYEKVSQQLHLLSLEPVAAETIFRSAASPFSGSPRARAAELMRLYRHPGIRAVFDVSGGDSANQILPYLDFQAIKEAGVPFIGISDLSVINNAIYTRTGLPAYHYRVKNLAGACAEDQVRYFHDMFMADRPAPPVTVHWLRGKRMSGTVIGGNIRCFLKLAGTPFFPDPAGKIIFLEALGGGSARMASLLAQLDQLGVFERCAGILLGTFSAMQKSGETPAIEELTLEISRKSAPPLAKTEQLGHGENARCLPIGMALTLGS